MEETFSFQEILNTLKKRLWLIISIIFGALIISAIITFFIMTPQYEASTQILVNQSENENEQSPTTDVESSRELISTYNVIITSPAILEPTIEKINYDSEVNDLRSKVNVSAEEESQIATVTVEDSDPQRAVMLANTISETFEEQIPNIMNVDNVSILSEAQLAESDAPVSPQPALNLILAIMIGTIAGIGLALLLDLLDKSIKSEQDVEKELGLPLLGVVPLIKEEENKKNDKNNSSSSKSRSSIRERERKTS